VHNSLSLATHLRTTIYLLLSSKLISQSWRTSAAALWLWGSGRLVCKSSEYLLGNRVITQSPRASPRAHLTRHHSGLSLFVGRSFPKRKEHNWQPMDSVPLSISTMHRTYASSWLARTELDIKSHSSASSSFAPHEYLSSRHHPDHQLVLF
jgi:hypothetical protein